MAIHHQNWAGNTPFNAARFHQPATIPELQEIVQKADKVRVIGSRHCFNDIADTTGDLVSLGKQNNTASIDTQNHKVTVNAGITYRELCPQLHDAGYALPNTASLDHITVVGACMSATHGSGNALGNLATPVSGLELIKADGELVKLERDKDGDRFRGGVVSLGALGIVTRVTLDLIPTFDVQQHVYEKLPLTRVFDAFDEVMGAGYSVSLFPSWQEESVESVWIKLQYHEGLTVPDTLYGAPLTADGPIWKDPVDRVWTEAQTPGPWHQRLPHFVFNDADQEGDELQSEYFVARHHAAEALKVVASLRDQLAPILVVSEIRTVAADDLWLSTAYGHDVVAIHFNWRKDSPGVARFLPILEAHLAPFQPRPHWGKLFALSPEQIQAAYPRMSDFQSLMQELDPDKKFSNAYIDQYISGA